MASLSRAAARASTARCSRARVHKSSLCQHDNITELGALMVRMMLRPDGSMQRANMCTLNRSEAASEAESLQLDQEEAPEAHCLQLDQEARLHMGRVAHTAQARDEETGRDDGSWKWAIRNRIWDLLEHEDIARHPRPVHHRIPNFNGAPIAASQLAGLHEFASARCIKVNPDIPQKTVRFLTLSGKKKLLVPQPRLRTGFFSEVEGSDLLRGALADACTAAGTVKYGKPVGTDAKLKVDLIVIGSVAVDPKTGARLGKGEGFADLEYAMLRYMGAINKYTCVATTVHEKQLVDDIPTEKLRVHDVPVDIICTPTRVIYTRTALPKPEGIYWDLLSPEKLEQIQVLRDLKRQIQRETGQLLPVGPSEELPPIAERRKTTDGSSKEKEPRIFVWNLNRSTPWTELKDHISSFGAEVLKVSLIRKDPLSKSCARVLLKAGTDVERLVKALDGSQLGKATLGAKIDES